MNQYHARITSNILQIYTTDPFLLDQAIEALRAYSLVQRDPRIQTVTIHRLVQTVLRDSMPIKTQQQWMQRAIEVVNAAFPSVKLESWPVCEQLLPHALMCATWIEQRPSVSPTTVRLLNRTGYYLEERARYAEAEPVYRRALETEEDLLVPRKSRQQWQHEKQQHL